MKPESINSLDQIEEVREKLISLFDDIYKKFSSLNASVYDFVAEEPIEQQMTIAVDSDDTRLHTQNTDTDLDATFEASIKDCDNHTSGSTNFVLAQQAAEADLNQTISDPPTQAEVQAISDKIDALLAKLRSANVIAT